MLEMLMLLGTGLAAAGLAGMSGIGGQATLETAKPAGAARKGYHLGDDYKGGEGEALLSQVRRLGGALDVAKLVPGLAGKAPQPATSATEVRVAPLAAPRAAAAVAAEATPADDEQVDFDGLLALLKNDPAAAPAEADETPEATEAPEALADAAGDAAEAAVEAIAADEITPQPDSLSWQDDQIPVISDFAAGSEELLLMLPEGMAPDTRVSIAASGPEGADAAVVLEDAEGRMTAVIVAGAYGSLEAADVVLETAA